MGNSKDDVLSFEICAALEEIQRELDQGLRMAHFPKAPERTREEIIASINAVGHYLEEHKLPSWREIRALYRAQNSNSAGRRLPHMKCEAQYLVSLAGNDCGQGESPPTPR